MAFFKLIGLFVPKMCKITTNPETAAYFWDKKYNSKIQIRHLDFNKKDSYNKMISEIGSKDLIKCDLINADTQWYIFCLTEKLRNGNLILSVIDYNPLCKFATTEETIAVIRSVVPQSVGNYL